MTRAAIHRRPREAGYSFVEVIMSVALLGGILLSVAGVFAIGSQSVKSGREMTKAVAIANTAVEQALAWPYELVYSFPGGAASDSTASWDTAKAYPAWGNVSAEDAADFTEVAGSWKARVESELQDGIVTFAVTGLGHLPVPGNPGIDAFEDAHFARVSITVEWTENGSRHRQVRVDELVL